jgi:tRNA dimethylallyltransferase
VLAMIEEGMVAEAQKVYPMRHYNSLNTVGYKELFEYIDGNISLDEAITKIQSNTRKYMRKQVTWFKRDQDIKWFNPSETKEIIKYIDCSLALGGK